MRTCGSPNAAGPAADIVRWQTKSARQTTVTCEDCNFNKSDIAGWSGDVVSGSYSFEFAFDAKIEHEFIVVISVNGESWELPPRPEMRASNQQLVPALAGATLFKYALHTSLDPRACSALNCTNFYEETGEFDQQACEDAGCIFAAGLQPARPNYVKLILDWNRSLLGDINVTVIRDCSGPDIDPITKQRGVARFYWENASVCTGNSTVDISSDRIECGTHGSACQNVAPEWGDSDSTGIVDIRVNHPGLYRVEVQTTSQLPGGGTIALQLPARQLSIGPGPVDLTTSHVQPPSLLHNTSASGDRGLGQYELGSSGPWRGERYRFSFVTFDSYLNRRIGREDLVVEISRVDRAQLSSTESILQKPGGASTFNITAVTPRIYTRTKSADSPEDSGLLVTVYDREIHYGDRGTGVYVFDEDIREFGVYQVKAWLCSGGNVTACLDRTNALSLAYTFSVCPQNTVIIDTVERVDAGLPIRNWSLGGTIKGAHVEDCHCKAGFKSPRGNGENCEACPRGKYQTDKSKSSCKPCAAGTSCGCSSANAGVDPNNCSALSWNPACSACDPCREDTYQDREGQGSCRPCRDGFDCRSTGMTFPIALPGYWVNNKNPREYYECNPPKACPGSSLIMSNGRPKPWSKVPSAQKKCTNTKPPDLGGGQRGYEEGDSSGCFEVFGSKCATGYTSGLSGTKCQDCCGTHNYNPVPGSSCDGNKWRKTTNGCSPCDKQNHVVLATMALLVAVMVAPIVLKFLELSKHLGAVHGPIMSVTQDWHSCLYACLLRSAVVDWNFLDTSQQWPESGSVVLLSR
jgi:hypothetical protein